MEKKLYTIVFDSDTQNYTELQVCCTKDDLDVICEAIVAKFIIVDDEVCTCVAKEGNYCDYSDWDYKYSDRM